MRRGRAGGKMRRVRAGVVWQELASRSRRAAREAVSAGTQKLKRSIHPKWLFFPSTRHRKTSEKIKKLAVSTATPLILQTLFLHLLFLECLWALKQ